MVATADSNGLVGLGRVLAAGVCRLGTLALSVALIGCQAGAQSPPANDGGDTGDGDRPIIGEPPTSRATSSKAGFVFPGDEVTLTGTGDDPDQGEDDADPVLRWFQIEGTPVDLAGQDTPQATFAVPDRAVPGEILGFELQVTDADGNTATDAVFMFLPRGEAVLLAVAAGPSEAVSAGQEVTLSSAGSLNIPEESARYQWEQIEGPAVELRDADTPTAGFTAPDPGADEIELTFVLTLANKSESAEDVVAVTVVPDDGDGGPDVPEPPDGGGDPAAGQAAYADAGCAACHGDDAAGGTGPDLQGADRTAALEDRFAGGANHFGAMLGDVQIADIGGWLATLDGGADGGDGACDAAEADGEAGAAVFSGSICSACHQADASGNAAIGAPDLRGGDHTAALEERFVPEGPVHNGASLTQDEIVDLACWFNTLG